METGRLPASVRGEPPGRAVEIRRVPTWFRRPALATTIAALFVPSFASGQSPSFRGGPEHLGTYAAPSASRSGIVAWSFRTDGPVRSSPAVVGDRVFFGSGDGGVYALDRASGAPVWRFDAGAPVHSSPAVDGERVYVADRRNRVHALDRESGSGVWTTETGPDRPWAWGHEGWDYFDSSPTVVGGRVFVGSGDGSVYALDAATGEILWAHSTGGRVRSSPAVSDGIVYVGSADGVLYALDADDGRVVWRFETAGVELSSAEFGFDRVTIQASPVVVDGVVYVGSRDGRAYAVDAADGSLIWQTGDATPWFIASHALSGASLYGGSSDGLYVHSLDAGTGEERWRTAVDQRVFSSPAVAGDAMYVGNHAGRLMKFSTADGALEWELRFGDGIMSSPVVADGHVYVGADDGHLRAIALADTPPPVRAVYWDSTRVARNTVADHERIRDHLRRRGYRVVDAGELGRFLAELTESPRPSVVVFAMDDVPPTLAGSPDDAAPLRGYLRAGGKLVWLGLPPFFLQRDSTGAPTAVSREAPEALLGVDHSTYDVDRVQARPTALGEAWGIDRWWIGGSGVPASDVGALALDDNGGAAAWVKAFGGPPGTGFVLLWGSFRGMPADFVETVHAVAEYGIGRAPR